ncbi:MAG: phage head-tail connector protein [Rhodospirillales bacterium]|nr:phage head-tail connector protein [Rhodospirillales bacterium]
MSLCALADVKTYLGITDTNSDAVLTALIASASAMIESYCNRIFAESSYTETRNGTGGAKLLLLNAPVTAVSSVTVDGYAVPAAPDAISPGYLFDQQVLYIRPGAYPGEFVRGIQNITVAYVAGYSTVPADVNQACVELIASKYAKRLRIDKKSETLGTAQTIGFDLSDMPLSVKTALAAYRRWGVQ